MGKVWEKYLPALLVLLSMVAAAAFAQEPDTVTELDPGVSIGLEVNRKLRLDLSSGREKSDELDSGKTKVSVGASLRLKPLFKTFIDQADSDKQHVLVVGTAYEYSRADEAGEEAIEHKLMFDATLRYGFPKKVLISDRNRLEFRWINGNYHFRYRNRLMFERPMKVKKYRLTPFASAEAYWDERFSTWNKYEFTGGVQLPLIRRSSLDLYYVRARCLTCSNPHTNIFGVSLNVFFRRKN